MRSRKSLERRKQSEKIMTIILILLLGISFLCAFILVGACVISARSRDLSEETAPVESFEVPHAKTPAVTPLQTTSTPLT